VPASADPGETALAHCHQVRGDTIVAVAGQPVTSLAEFLRAA